ncbi:hypothetical protein GOV09_02135 [Candidatus Woesearchaeota archaeon]|nr:hypothetical protein [Candidatus Woesearchaeota archaeon]
MAFDPNLDQKLFAETKELETTRLTVSVHSYNGGEKKMQISRENRNQNNEWNFSKLGRMLKDEAQAVLPLMQKAMGEMEKPLE